MNNSKYTIGIDYGTQSGRAVLIDINTGKEIATQVMTYKHGVIDKYLPYANIKLEDGWALQDPDDYLDMLYNAVPKLVINSGVNVDDIIGIAVDFTACTILPVAKDGRALCQLEDYRKIPHAWVKLWKHHAAQEEANKLTKIAIKRGEKFINRYGGKISSEWLVPKVWQIINEAPEVYNAAYKFMEAADWIIMKLTGLEKRNSCTAGYKALWNKKDGYPSNEFFKCLDVRLEHLVEEKLSKDIFPIGSKAGTLTEVMAKKMELKAGIAVAVANLDAHVAVPALNVVGPEKMAIVLGTSICHMVLSEEEKMVPGICGVVEDGIVQGYFGYEAGQPAGGDIFGWFVQNCVPESYEKDALIKGMSIHELLEYKASMLKPGESGLLALDWWNGNRSTLVNADLTGLIVGLTLLTKPEEIYRTLIEATAFGTKAIIENFNSAGVIVKELYACGGLVEKNKMLMQIYSDVTNMEIRVAESIQTPALGAAMFAAVAAGSENGGYDSIVEAAKYMARLKDEIYRPIPENVSAYKEIYEEYKKLYSYFGNSENNIMKKLKDIRNNVSK